ALAGRMPRPELRLALLHNVADEHCDGDLSLSHERTFLALLARLGVTLAEVERRALWPEVRAFNSALTALCVHDDAWTAMAALGMIERLFATISSELGSGIVARGWLKPEELVHYRTHETLDLEHARGFLEPLKEPWSSHPRHAYQVQQGLELGGYLLMRLYRDLYEARARRWTREVDGPHSLADGWYLPR
ncbi:MAG: iron-containing redox enzyme family protein, partial [Myxococcales bacterium]